MCPTASSLTHNKKCSEFKEMIEFAIKNAEAIKSFGPGLGLVGHFVEMMAAAHCYVHEMDVDMQRLLLKRKWFLTLCHDVWESKNKEVLGVSLGFYSIGRKRHFLIPIALHVIDDKCAEPTADLVENILAATGIDKEQIHKACNDTCYTALKVGRLLAGENRVCTMHQIQLYMDHVM
ncbi:unknown protein [Seminavis robusta]|uniref:Uncharacterized protein n=1 Tax=Seminavis robusta TaxID=568900 RepID=A0A9N8HS74_9STRA|nr:unknown protein [Seminavis robusta]|eukprot:Sro1487_g276700.1 n/a (177) ;mRNA; f:3800-4330